MSIARHHAEWLALVEVSGPFLSLPVLLRVFPQGLEAADPELTAALRQAAREWEADRAGRRPDPAIHHAWVRFVLQHALRLPATAIAEGQQIPAALHAAPAAGGEIARPDLVIHQPGDPAAPRLLARILPPGQGLERAEAGGKTSPRTRMVDLLRASGLSLGLLTNGEEWMLVNARKGEPDGAASWYTALWLEEPLTLRAFSALLGARRLFGVPAGETLEALLEQSAADQHEVTDQLGLQVRQAVEILIQALDRGDKDRGRALLRDVDEQGLYNAALTVMMRLVFLFYAEERALLPRGNALYDESYAVSTLRARLRAAADQWGEEVLARRRDAWSRLLATFRAVHGGVEHAALRLPAYGGHLFDPDAYPFLEGRPAATSWSDTPAQPLPIDNRTVLHLLEALQVLRARLPGGGPAEARLLSFRALDVEQIGHVYEGLLDHTAVRAADPMLGLAGAKGRQSEVALAALEALHARGDAALLAFLKEQTGRAEPALRRALSDGRKGPDQPDPKGSWQSTGPEGPWQGEPDPEGSWHNTGPEGPLDVAAPERSLDTTAPDQARLFDAWNEQPTRPRSASAAMRLQSQAFSAQAPSSPAMRLQSQARGQSHASSAQASSQARLLAACDNDHALYARVRPFAALLREDTLGYPVVIAAGSVYVTQGSDRRSTGTHYTPRSLTEPVVQYTLEPLVYEGPAEGWPRQQWRLRPAAELLSLKVCDMAMGSGAFLVAACRYLAERLLAAWAAAEAAQPGRVIVTPEGALSQGLPGEQPLPTDPEERAMLARRLVADRCLYGVDVNSMAVEMAKLSLWLVTMQRDRPFTFLDHALRHGDALLGVDLAQLRALSLTPQADRGSIAHQVAYFEQATNEALEVAITRRLLIEGMAETSVRDTQEKARLLRQAEQAMALVTLGGDLLAASGLVAKEQRERIANDLLYRYQLAVMEAQEMARAADAAVYGRSAPFSATAQAEAAAAVADLSAEAARLLGARRPFHWPLEFPEVFTEGSVRDDPLGFDAIVGNPPFLGGQRITGALGTAYRDYLVEYLANGQRGSADLCAYFFLRARGLLRPGGGFGLLATNTIAQGDTREVGLDQIVAAGSVITRAVPSRPWPGEASLEVAHVWARRGRWNGPYLLDEQPVSGITPFLTAPGAVQGKPYRLAANAGKSFQGSIVLGMGFVLDPEDEEQEAILGSLLADPRNRDALFPYLNGEDLNSRPDQSPSRWVINFHDWPLERAETYPDLMAIVREKVKPEREKNNRKVYRDRWWHYGEKRPELYATIAGMERVLALSLVSNHVSIAFAPKSMVFAHRLAVFPLDQWCHFALLQSHFHYHWAWAYSSTMRVDLNYSPSDCFETFPFPDAAGEPATAVAWQRTGTAVPGVGGMVPGVGGGAAPGAGSSAAPGAGSGVVALGLWDAVTPETEDGAASETEGSAMPGMESNAAGHDTRPQSASAAMRPQSQAPSSQAPSSQAPSSQAPLSQAPSSQTPSAQSQAPRAVGVGPGSAGVSPAPHEAGETPALPGQSQSSLSLDDIGERYYAHRQSIMRARGEGLTKTYNRFHDPNETDEQIARLRALHMEMDRAVAAAYGWSDLPLDHGFHQTKQGLRFTISEPARREVLGRLLALNHARYREEEALGLHARGTKNAKGAKGASRGGRAARSGGKGSVPEDMARLL